MNKLLLLAFMFFMSELSLAVCNSPIARTNFTYLEKLTSARLNSELNTVYSQVNELPGDCITSETITTSQILNGTIVNNDISPTAAISRGKLAPNFATSSSSGVFNNATTGPLDVTNLSVSITTTGAPVEITFIPEGGSNLACWIAYQSVVTSSKGYLNILRDTVLISTHFFGSPGTDDSITSLPGSSIRLVDFVPAGTYAYKVQAGWDGFGAGTTGVYYCKLLAREL